ncbi:hypothetical protein D9M69_682900 [compost metagenome]
MLFVADLAIGQKHDLTQTVFLVAVIKSRVQCGQHFCSADCVKRGHIFAGIGNIEWRSRDGVIKYLGQSVIETNDVETVGGF